MSTGMPAGIWLHKFGTLIRDYFGHVAYQVGSSLDRKDWRDVDVRLILPDDEFAALRAEGFAEAVTILRDDDLYRNWWSRLDERDPNYGYWGTPARNHLADYLETLKMPAEARVSRDTHRRTDVDRNELLDEGRKQARIHGVNPECAPIYAEGWAAATRAALPEVVTLQPGQRALLVYKRDLTREEAYAIKQRLAELYPNNEINVADSVDHVIVLPPKDR